MLMQAKGIVCDGCKGLFKAFQEYYIHLCQFLLDSYCYALYNQEIQTNRFN